MSEMLPAVREEKPPLVPLQEDGLIWERLQGETSAAYQKFVVYRNQTRGRHSLAKAAKELEMGVDRLKELSAQHSWVDRSDAYDDHLERRDREAREQARDEINKQGVTLGRSIMALTAARLAGGKYRGQDVGAIDPHDLEANELPRLADIGWRMARLGSGQATDAVRGLVTVTTEDHLKIVDALYQITVQVLPEERHQRFATLWNQFLDTGRLPWS